MNLITNASDALHDAEGEITVRTRRTESVEDVSPNQFVGEPATGGPWVRLEVMDSGSGMDQDTLSRIFDPFFTTKFTGRGLGLAATIGIMRGHQGAIAVQSAPGQGTTFTLFFPPIESAPRRITPTSQPAVAQGYGTVLVVDDDAGVRRVTETLLERHGFRVVIATDGRQAVELCRTHPGEYRAVLLDLTMPVMGGSEAFHRIRELDALLPIILMSGYSDVQIEQTFGQHQLAGFLQKPFKAQELYAVIATAVAQ
jgi:CheY-like chemotaxis protein